MPTRSKHMISPRHLALVALPAAVSMLAVAFASPGSQTGGAGMASGLADAVIAYRQATIRGDIATLSNLVAHDYVLVNSDSSLQAKQSYLEDFRLPGFKVERYEVRQSAQQVWGDTALVRELVHLAWTQGGEQHRRGLRIAHVWNRRDGRWQIAYTQLTRVPDP